MNSDKSNKEVILQQLRSLSKEYEELLKCLDETEHSLQKPSENKSSWAEYFKKKVKKHENNTRK